jgi:hypothetical protein
LDGFVKTYRACLQADRTDRQGRDPAAGDVRDRERRGLPQLCKWSAALAAGFGNVTRTAIVLALALLALPDHADSKPLSRPFPGNVRGPAVTKESLNQHGY